MNKVILCGRLTRDPDVRYTNSQSGEQTCISRFTLAVDRRFKKDETDYISCVAFGKTGEFVEKYLHQGTKIIVSGRIQTGSYTNKDGVKIYTTDVVVEEAEFAESKKDSSRSSENDSSNDGFMDIPEDAKDTLPFKNR